jgi:hypothetical protein
LKADACDIAIRERVIVDEEQMARAETDELLGDGRSGAAGSNDGHSQISKDCLDRRTERTHVAIEDGIRRFGSAVKL